MAQSPAKPGGLRPFVQNSAASSDDSPGPMTGPRRPSSGRLCERLEIEPWLPDRDRRLPGASTAATARSTGCPVNGRTGCDQPVAGPTLEVAPASTPSTNYDKLRGLSPFTAAAHDGDYSDKLYLVGTSAFMDYKK